MSKYTQRLSILAIAVIGAVAASQASASGFQLRENSVKNIGKAYAGSAVATDGSSVYNTPAAIQSIAPLPDHAATIRLRDRPDTRMR